MASKRDSTPDVLLRRNEELSEKLRETRKQLSAALADNKALRRRIEIRQVLVDIGGRRDGRVA